MAAKKRKRAGDELVVKASILIGVRDHAIWGACASLQRMDRSAFAVAAIKAACDGLVLIDKRKPDVKVRSSDRPIEADPVKLSGSDDAA